MSEDWKVYFLDKFKHVNDKAAAVTQSISDKEDLWTPEDMADHLRDIIDVIQHLESKIDDLQYQLDNNKINPSSRKQLVNELFPYMYLLHTYYTGGSHSTIPPWTPMDR